MGIVPGEVSSQYENDIFYCEKNHSLEQRPQGHGRLPITEGL